MVELGELGNGGRLAGLTKFLDARIISVCLHKRDGLSLGVGIMD